MNDYAAIPIPPRGEQDPVTAANRAPVRNDGAARPGADFAQIELGSSAGSSAGGYAGAAAAAALSSATLPEAQRIPPARLDPVRKKFDDMRSITAGNPFARNDVGFFYRQARLMEDFTDDFGEEAEFSMYYPCYQYMGYKQLRTYFTWRTGVRAGRIEPVSVSYVFVYIYELLSGIGADSPLDGLEKLMSIWKAIGEHSDVLDKYMPRWLFDYHIYYELPDSFADFIEINGLRGCYGEHFLFDASCDDRLMAWNGISNYDVRRSRLYGDGNEALFRDSFEAVILAIEKECERRGVSTDDLLSHNSDYLSSWYPFKRALFYNWLSQPDRQVTAISGKKYICKDNHWKTSISIPYTWRKDFAGYLIKKTDLCLRRLLKYNYKLTVDATLLQRTIGSLKKPFLPFKILQATVEKAVDDFFNESTRTVVTVDSGNLERIRAEALGTQEALIVQEDEAEVELEAEVEAESEAESEADSVEAENRFEDTTSRDLPDAEDQWAVFKDALDGHEAQALELILAGGGLVRAFANGIGAMLEVLVDNINDKAMDIIGDSIVEVDGEPRIYDEYVHHLRSG